MKTSAFKRNGLVAAITLIALFFALSVHARVVAYTEATEHFPKMLDDMPACNKAYQEYLYVEKKLNACTAHKEQCPDSNQQGSLTEQLHDKEKRVCDKCQNKWPARIGPYERRPCKKIPSTKYQIPNKPQIPMTE